MHMDKLGTASRDFGNQSQKCMRCWVTEAWYPLIPIATLSSSLLRGMHISQWWTSVSIRFMWPILVVGVGKMDCQNVFVRSHQKMFHVRTEPVTRLTHNWPRLTQMDGGSSFVIRFYKEAKSLAQVQQTGERSKKMWEKPSCIQQGQRRRGRRCSSASAGIPLQLW